MPSRHQLNAIARSLGFDPTGIANDSKLEQKVLWLIKNAAAKTGTAAVSTLTSDNTDVADGDTVTIGPITYRFKNTMTQAFDVKRDGTTADNTLNSLIAAINGSGTPGTDYSIATGYTRHPFVTAGTVSAHAFTLTAKETNIGADLATTTTATHLSLTGATLNAGTPGVAGVIATPATNAAGSGVKDTNPGIAGDRNTSI